MFIFILITMKSVLFQEGYQGIFILRRCDFREDVLDSDSPEDFLYCLF